MKRIFLLVLTVIIFAGCDSAKKTGDFSGEYLTNFPDVKNIINYLDIDASKTLVLTDSSNKLVFAFSAEDVLSYVRELESEKYDLTGLDATISSTFVLENAKHIIHITSISDIDEVKKTRTDISNISEIRDENIIFSITNK